MRVPTLYQVYRFIRRAVLDIPGRVPPPPKGLLNMDPEDRVDAPPEQGAPIEPTEANGDLPPLPAAPGDSAGDDLPPVPEAPEATQEAAEIVPPAPVPAADVTPAAPAPVGQEVLAPAKNVGELITDGNSDIVDALAEIRQSDADIAQGEEDVELAEESLHSHQSYVEELKASRLDRLRSAKAAVDKQRERLDRTSARLQAKIDAGSTPS